MSFDKCGPSLRGSHSDKQSILALWLWIASLARNDGGESGPSNELRGKPPRIVAVGVDFRNAGIVGRNLRARPGRRLVAAALQPFGMNF